jgi:hypothetical protein
MGDRPADDACRFAVFFTHDSAITVLRKVPMPGASISGRSPDVSVMKVLP